MFKKDCCNKSASQHAKFCTECGQKLEIAYNCTIGIFGGGGVGKIDEYNPTIAEEYTKRVDIDGKLYTVVVQDTAGQEEFKALLPQTIRDCDCFIIVYDVTSQSSYGEVETHITRILQTKEVAPSLITVTGNKCDLEKKVNPSYTREFCHKYGYNFAEVSAKKHQGIDELFLQLVRQFEKEKSKSPEPKPVVNKSKGLFSSISQTQEDDVATFESLTK